MSARSQSLYLAYGSNLHLTQMSTRCPESRYQGWARLQNYQWQINDRGFANVIPDSRPDAEDEARLDRNEGVPTAYEKKFIEVKFFTAIVSLIGRKVTEILGYGLICVTKELRQEPSRPAPTDAGEFEPPYSARYCRTSALGSSIRNYPQEDR